MYQELQRKKIDLQLRKPYDLDTAVELRELDQLDQMVPMAQQEYLVILGL